LNWKNNWKIPIISSRDTRPFIKILWGIYHIVLIRLIPILIFGSLYTGITDFTSIWIWLSVSSNYIQHISDKRAFGVFFSSFITSNITIYTAIFTVSKKLSRQILFCSFLRHYKIRFISLFIPPRIGCLGPPSCIFNQL